MVEAAARAPRLPDLTKYELIEELGHGGMATVYRARDRRLGREVAVKVLHPHLRDSRDVLSRFRAEAKAVAKLRHPNIVEVYDVSEADDPEQYLVVELVPGTTLRRLLDERGAMPPEVAACVACELLGALGHAHASGVVHRDIKPENVLIELGRRQSNSDASTPVLAGEQRLLVKLTDFGIAKLADAKGVTSTGQLLGSPAHMAPEQIDGGEVDARSDVFALGVLLYECMVGHLPFEGANPAQVMRQVLEGKYPEPKRERPLVGARWSAIIDGALARLAAARYASAGVMREAILAELQRVGVSAPGDELQAWLEDPAGYGARHAEAMTAKLCALAAASRKKGDAISAAADYNRALAYAPDDAALLRAVAEVNRARTVARATRTTVSFAIIACGFFAVTFFVLHEMAARRGAPPSPPPPGATQAPTPVPTATPSAIPIPTAIPIPNPIPTPPPTHAAIPPPAPAGAAARGERAIALDLKPPMGVRVSIDGDPARQVSSGDHLTLSSKAHLFTFTCDVCNPVRVPLAAGDRDQALVVSVPVKPATLVVDADPGKAYQLVEHPEIVVHAGVSTVPLKSAFERVTVKQMETGAAAQVRLEAGKAVHVTLP